MCDLGGDFGLLSSKASNWTLRYRFALVTLPCDLNNVRGFGRRSRTCECLIRHPGIVLCKTYKLYYGGAQKRLKGMYWFAVADA